MFRVSKTDPERLDEAWDELSTQTLVMFVSANAVAHFFATRQGKPWPAKTIAGSTGPGTTAALREAGVPSESIVEPLPGHALDSESLWLRLQAQPWAGRRVLVVRGEGGRDWLADQLTGAGAQVQFLAAYRRLPPTLDASAQLLLNDALHQPHRFAWHFSSSEAARHVAAYLPTGSGEGASSTTASWSQAPALATHPRIASAVRGLGFQSVQLVEPGLDALVAVVKALCSGASPRSPAA